MNRSAFYLSRFYPESRFGGFCDPDGTVVFYGRIQAILDGRATVLDVGCGRGAGLCDDPVAYRRKLRDLRNGGERRVIGIDVDPWAANNTGLDEFHCIDGVSPWPLPDASIDLVLADFVLEHLDNPDDFFAQTYRVLKPGGLFCARTSNRIGYVGILASLIPNRRHGQVLKIAQNDRKQIDVFPTCYHVNTVWALRRALKKSGLDGIAYGYDAEPSYLGFSSLVYGLGKILHAFTPSILKTTIFAFAFKPK